MAKLKAVEDFDGTWTLFVSPAMTNGWEWVAKVRFEKGEAHLTPRETDINGSFCLPNRSMFEAHWNPAFNAALSELAEVLDEDSIRS